jgi:hypothetical protein
MRAWTMDADDIHVAEDFDESLLHRTPEIDSFPSPDRDDKFIVIGTKGFADDPDVPGRSPVVTIPVTAVRRSGRKCVCRRLARQHGRRILHPVRLPDRGC